MTEDQIAEATVTDVHSLVPLIVVVLIAIVFGIGSTYILGNNNPVEFIAEDVIQKETGLKVNLDINPKITSYIAHIGD